MGDEDNIYLSLSNGMDFAEMLHLKRLLKSEVPEKEKLLLITSTVDSNVSRMVASYNKYNDQ